MVPVAGHQLCKQCHTCCAAIDELGMTTSHELRRAGFSCAAAGKPRQPRAPAADGGGGPRKVSNKLFMSGAFKPAPVRLSTPTPVLPFIALR